MRHILSYSSDREKVCKLCDKPIPKLERCFAIMRVHVSPKTVNLFFHEACFKDASKEVRSE